MQDCQRLCNEAGIQFRFTIQEADFIREMSSSLADNLFGPKPPTYDAAIVNPPYRKIGTDSAERQSLRQIGVETSNLYAGFIAIIQRLLAPGGQLVGITPRAFATVLISAHSAKIFWPIWKFSGCMFLNHAAQPSAKTACCRKILFSMP
jgi:tRNA1(Val) A37 N6-methylase TrmN6